MKNLHVHDVTIYHSPSLDAYGRQSWSTSVSTKGRFLKKKKRMIDDQGEETTSDAELWVINSNKDLDSVAVGDKVTYDSEDYRIMTLNEATKATGGHHHFEMVLKSWQ